MVYEFPVPVSAAGILLDRGWGRAPQPHTSDGSKDIRITIRSPLPNPGFMQF